ncbi:hypothetical protein ACQPZJ_01665 [Actinoplanes sp. CA-054009]
MARVEQRDLDFQHTSLKIQADLGRMQDEHGLTNAEMSLILSERLRDLAQQQVRSERRS